MTRTIDEVPRSLLPASGSRSSSGKNLQQHQSIFENVLSYQMAEIYDILPGLDQLQTGNRYLPSLGRYGHMHIYLSCSMTHPLLQYTHEEELNVDTVAKHLLQV